MNQERFDEPTRAPATTPLSRRQGLKGLLAGADVGASSKLFAVGNEAGSPLQDDTEPVNRKGDHGSS
jgi:hypothetical protein